MPITKSAKKALRQSKRRAVRNLARKEAYKSVLKRIQKLLISKKVADAEKLVPGAYQAIDKAAKTNVIKKNAAARYKSRLMRSIRKSKPSA